MPILIGIGIFRVIAYIGRMIKMGDRNSSILGNLMPSRLIIPARLSNNTYIHLLIMLAVNIAVITSLLSIYEFALFINKNHVMLYILAFTYLEFIAKTLSFRYLIRYIAMTYGMILFVENILLFAIIDLVFDYNFYFISFDHLVAFAILFTIIRLIILTFINKKLMLRRMKKAVRWLDGKK